MSALKPSLGILVGGESQRFPGGKLVADFCCRPLLLHVLESLSQDWRQNFQALYLLGHPPGELSLPADWHVLPDPEEGHGPLSGYLALSRVSPEGFLISGGDMPFLRPEPLVRLWQESMNHRAASLEIEGRPHPLLVAIRNSAYPLLESLFQQPRLPGPGRLLEEVVAHRVSPAELGLDPEQAKQLVFDVDTPKDLETAISMHLRHLF